MTIKSFKKFRRKIDWIKPDLNAELGEYFENKHTKRYFAKRGFLFQTTEELLGFLGNGKLTTITQDELKANSDNLTLDPADFETEMQDDEYSKSYKDMETKLENGITLPAPIIIQFEDKYYGFAGNRRTNLAFNNNLPLKVWLVDANI